MKKGFWVYSILVLILLFAIMILSGNVSATYTCSDGQSDTPCVCGHTPNSTLGYGQVIIGNAAISCSNIADGVCPEDFQDANTGQVASCSSCIDPDCTGTLTGVVSGASGPIFNALVTSRPIRWSASANIETNSTSDYLGNYTLTAPTGTYYFSAEKSGYDTELLQAKITRNQMTTLDFNLANGTCHPDCTNSYNRCNAACDGVEFQNNATNCTFYSAPIVNMSNNIVFDYDTQHMIKTACNNRLAGTQVFLTQYNSTYAWYMDCCGASGSAPYLQYYATASTISSGIKNLIKVEKIATYNDVPVRLVIAYWQN